MTVVRSGIVDVDALHRLHYEVHGNPKGETIIFVHGGPGLSTSAADLEYFDLASVNVVLFDQRGCGKSFPKGVLEYNTTQDLVEDMAKLLHHLGLHQVYLFGGSWGSTLSLLFALRYPSKVKGMILRGLFTATIEERKNFEHGRIRDENPEIWNRFTQQVPEAYRSDAFVYYCNKILKGNDTEVKRFAFELNYYAHSVSDPSIVNVSSDIIETTIKASDYINKARILAHYSTCDFFISDRYIEQNFSSILHLPIRIVQGVNDKITLPVVAEKLAAKFKNITLVLVDGGHSPKEKLMKEELMKAVVDMV